MSIYTDCEEEDAGWGGTQNNLHFINENIQERKQQNKKCLSLRTY